MTPQLGEGFAGSGADAAHVNTVLGLRDGPVGTAWATALASPSAGHVPFVVVVRPNLPVVPFTLFVNKAAIVDDRHGTLTWGAAQAGVAAGVGRAFREGVFGADPRDLALIAAVWVNPAAADEEAVFANNTAATHAALVMGTARGPSLDELRAALVADPANPYFRTT
jgi:5,6,7,8-tetrahydromethanopterin hydro-lyase